MKTNIGTLLLTAAVALPALIQAQPVYTPPVGFVSVTIPANSDAVLAVPLNRASEFQGVVSSIVGNTITLSGTPGWTANQYAPLATANKTYAVQIASGTKEGLIAKIISNTTNSLTVQLDAGDDLTGVVAGASGDQVDIFPYWTPGSLLPTTLAAGTQFIGFENAGAGVNLGASELFAYTGAGWEDEITTDDVTHAPLRFGRSFVLRNNSGSSASISIVGAVPMTSFRTRLATLANNTDQDTQIGYVCPVPEAIVDLDIPATAGDILFGFDNSSAGINKGAATIYVFDGNNWVDDITSELLDSNTKLQPGFGYLFRKAATTTPQSVVWVHTPSYLN